MTITTRSRKIDYQGWLSPLCQYAGVARKIETVKNEKYKNIVAALKTLENFKDNIFDGVLFLKNCKRETCNFSKVVLYHGCFPVQLVSRIPATSCFCNWYLC